MNRFALTTAFGRMPSISERRILLLATIIVLELGAEVNRFLAGEIVASVADILPWLEEAIAHFYPARPMPHHSAPPSGSVRHGAFSGDRQWRRR
jgi:hypothetical protein